MPFSVSWHTLLDELDDLSDGAELITPLSHDRFRITDVQEHRVGVTFTEKGDQRRCSAISSRRFTAGYRKRTMNSTSTACHQTPIRIPQS